MSGDFRIKKWNADVNGHATVHYYAGTQSKARMQCYWAYSSAYDCTFKRFLQISRVTRNRDPLPDHFGDPITVGGEPAFYVGYAGGNSIHFARPGSDDVSLTHELDAVLPWNKTETTDVSISERGCAAH